MRRWVPTGAVAAAALAVGVASAQTPVPLALSAGAAPRGHVSLTVTGTPGQAVTLTETTTRRPKPVATLTLDDAGAATTRRVTWTCTTRRAFTVTDDATGASTAATVQTPSCRDRFRLKTDRPPRVGRRFTVTASDTFGLKASPSRICLATVCKRAPATFTPTATGPATLTARHAITLPLRVKRLVMLDAGDSQMQILDRFLAQRLPHVESHSDAHPSTGLTKPFLLDWAAHARKTVARYQPDVTVMIVGTNDGYALGDVACCEGRWIDRYAGRVSDMIETYAQGGTARVYWCLLPAPEDADFRRIFLGVNRAIRRAVRRHPKTARLVDLPQTFTPGYVYRARIGQTTVRQPDGVHLTPAGASLAANVIRRQIKRDGAL